MKGFYFVLACIAALVGSQLSFAAAKIDPLLKDFADGNTSYNTAPIMVLFEAKTEGVRVPRRYDTRNVVNYLQAVSQRSIRVAQEYLHEQGAIGTEVTCSKIFWINASMACRVTPEGLRILSRAPGASKIYANQRTFRDPVKHGAKSFLDGSPKSGVPYDLVDMHWDKLVAEQPNITGKGVVIGHVDTGVDATHPALVGRIKLYYDAEKKQRTTPSDSDTHGTHTAGSMIGNKGKDGGPLGVAPEAELIAAGPLASYDGMLNAMQFMIDPDGDATTKDMPRAINNSWNCGGAPDVELFYRAIGAWEAAGILPVFSAGNSGPRKGSITPPHEHPLAFAVAASGKSGFLADFSSRGPGKYKGQETQKPDITAPGEDIVSTIPGGGYTDMSGTSMATPHVTGATALLFQVDPQLTPAQVRNILIQTAVPRNSNGGAGQQGVWDYGYGFGKIDIYAAVNMAAQTAAKRNGQNLGLLEILKNPRTLLIESIVEAKAEPVDEVFNYPATMEGSSEDWLSELH